MLNMREFDASALHYPDDSLVNFYISQTNF